MLRLTEIRMIDAYRVADGLLQKLDCSNDTPGLAEATWIDLIEPSKEEEEAVEALLHVDIPTREEMRSIDESSQVYRDGETLVMTLRIISRSTTPSLRLI